MKGLREVSIHRTLTTAILVMLEEKQEKLNITVRTNDQRNKLRSLL